MLCHFRYQNVGIPNAWPQREWVFIAVKYRLTYTDAACHFVNLTSVQAHRCHRRIYCMLVFNASCVNISKYIFHPVNPMFGHFGLICVVSFTKEIVIVK